MQTLSHGQFVREFEGPPAGGVYARFFMEAVQDPLASAEQNRPIFHQEERVEIIIPGDNTKVHVKRVSDAERARWPREYEAFRQGIDVVPDGMPLEECAWLNKSQVAELKFLGFRTIEDIAGASDTVLQRFPGGFGLREKAKAWLDDAAATAFTEKLSSENDQLRAEVSHLQRQLTEQGEILRQIHAEMMTKKNAPHPFETATAAMLDPLAGGGQAEGGGASSLAGFDAVRRRPGRPRKEEAA